MNMTDYETARRTFRLQVPEDYEFTRDVVEHWAAQHPGKLALVAVDERGEHRREISFGELATRLAARRQRPRGARRHGGRARVRDAPAHPRVVRAAARHVPPRRRADAGHDALHGARHRPAHRARAGHGRRRRRGGRGEARRGARAVHVAAPRDRRRHARRGRLRALRRAARARQRRRADRARHARRRPAAPLLHVGHGRGAEDGAAHARLMGAATRSRRASGRT